MTRISAVSDQGTCSCPGRHRTPQKLVQPQLLDQFQRQPRAAELPAVLHAYPRAVDLDEPRLGLRLRKESPVAAKRAAARPLAPRPTGPPRPSAPDRPPFAAADHARCDTTRPAPNTLRVGRCADENGAAGTCPHVSDDSRDLFPLHALARKIPRPTRSPSPSRHDLRQNKLPEKSTHERFCQIAGEVGLGAPMTSRGHVKNGQITLDDPIRFPEGAEVVVALVEKKPSNDDDLNAVLLRHAGQGQDLPTDLAAQHDHYAHGKPKR